MDATILLGGNDKYNTLLSWEEASQNGMSVMTMDKMNKQTLALQASLEASLMEFEGVKNATVYINRPIENSSINEKKEDTTVGVKLELENNAQISTEMANAMAQFLMNTVGNTDTNNISIVTQQGELLFGGSGKDGNGTAE